MIQVIGEALIDIIVDTDGHVGAEVGGAPVNTARTIARLGQAVEYLGGISADSFGQRIARDMVSDGVFLSIAPELPEPSTVALASLDHSGAATYRFLFEGTAASSVTVELALSAYNPRALAVHIGTLALVLEPLIEAVRAIIDRIPESQILMVDPNARPSIMSADTQFGYMWNTVIRRADVIKVSGDDLDFLFPTVDPAEAAFQLHRDTGSVVLFTDGAQSVTVFCGGDSRTLPVPKVSVVDTVGAGDSFSGGFLTHWANQSFTRVDLGDLDKVVSAAEFGIRVAGITCQRAGAQPPFAHEL